MEMFGIRWHKVYSVILRHVLQSKYNLARIFDAIFWPVIDLLLWGITSKFIESNTNGLPSIVPFIISGIVFWMIIYRHQNILTVSLLEDFWNRSLLHYFIAPMRRIEYFVGILSFSFIKLTITIIFACIISYILYKVNIFSFGAYLALFVLSLVLTGTWFGFLVLGIILRYGTKVEILAWSLVAVMSPFSAIYYPLSILPLWAQKIAMVIPSSYIFEGMREVIATGYFDWNKFTISMILNLIFLVLSIWYLNSCFNKVLEKGLVKVF